MSNKDTRKIQAFLELQRQLYPGLDKRSIHLYPDGSIDISITNHKGMEVLQNLIDFGLAPNLVGLITSFYFTNVHTDERGDLQDAKHLAEIIAKSNNLRYLELDISSLEIAKVLSAAINGRKINSLTFYYGYEIDESAVTDVLMSSEIEIRNLVHFGVHVGSDPISFQDLAKSRLIRTSRHSLEAMSLSSPSGDEPFVGFEVDEVIRLQEQYLPNCKDITIPVDSEKVSEFKEALPRLEEIFNSLTILTRYGRDLIGDWQEAVDSKIPQPRNNYLISKPIWVYHPLQNTVTISNSSKKSKSVNFKKLLSSIKQDMQELKTLIEDRDDIDKSKFAVLDPETIDNLPSPISPNFKTALYSFQKQFLELKRELNKLNEQK